MLDPEAVAAALALRSEETVERSTQREQLGESVLHAEAAAESWPTRRRSTPSPATGWSGSPMRRSTGSSRSRATRSRRSTAPAGAASHTGLDMAAPSGTPIYAMADGEIVSAEYEGGYGNRTVIRHEDGTETWYCHQSRFELTSGSVEGGELIGYVGSTGNSTGPHLHLEVHPSGGDPINPLTWMRARPHGLSPRSGRSRLGQSFSTGA